MSILSRSDSNKAYYCRISSRTGDIINYLFEERHIMQNTEKSKIDIIADILRTVLLRIVQEQKIAG